MWIFLGTLTYILILLICILSYAIDYLTNVIQVESFSQFLYTMNVSMGGAENTIMQILQGFFTGYLFWIVLATILYVYVLRTLIRARKNVKAGKPAFSRSSHQRLIRLSTALTGVVAACVFCSQLKIGYDVLGIEQYRQEQSYVSSLYEEHYAEPREITIRFPEKKKNLIHIYVESLESTYADLNSGGGFEDNLIPNLTRLAKENNDFSAPSDSAINGARVTNKTSWTVAGIVAQTSGTPLGSGNNEYKKNFEGEMEFMPHVTTLGQLLQQQGYVNVFLCGSDASYAGRSNYLQQHGDYQIIDWVSKREDGTLPENYKEWWGFEDSKLFAYAKEELTRLASKEQPFNFTMLTADTHFKDGYLCDDCPEIYDEQYENVIRCSDKRIAEFVAWIQQQDFYKDSVIIISGDHLSMDGLIPSEIDHSTIRRTYFNVINGPEKESQTTRQFSTLDIFPTTVEALGADIEGHRLGLGVSLYSDEPTLTEQMGFSAFNQEIAYRSNYYEQVILKGDDAAADAGVVRKDDEAVQEQ